MVAKISRIVYSTYVLFRTISVLKIYQTVLNKTTSFNPLKTKDHYIFLLKSVYLRFLLLSMDQG